MELSSRKVSRIAFAYLWSILFWMGLASLAAGEDKVRIWERGLHTSYWTALLVDGAFLLTAALLTPPVFAIVHRYPITKPICFGRVAGYVLGIAHRLREPRLGFSAALIKSGTRLLTEVVGVTT